MSRFRSSTGHVDYADEEPQRWDRDKFERFSSRRPAGHDREEVDISIERQRFEPRMPPSRVAVEERFERRPPRPRFEERERFYEEERFGPPSRRRTDFMYEPTAAEIANQALAPYRRRPTIQEEPAPPVRRPRPQMLRRQSSLDTFDRRPMPRYEDDYRLPPNMPIPLPIRRPHSPPRRFREREEIIEDVRVGRKGGAEFDEYRDIRVRRERHGGGRSRSRAATSVRSSSSSSSSFEEVNVPATPAPPPQLGKKGKTRMPKRLAHKKAVAELGIPFEEEDDFLIIQRALQKEHIDEIIEKSKTYKEEKTIYKYEGEVVGEKETVKEEVKEEKKEVKEEKKEEKIEEKIEEKKEEKKEEAPPPPPASVHPGETVIKERTIILEGNPPPAPPSALGLGPMNPPSAPGTVRGHSPARSVASHATHKTHKSHHTSHSFHPQEIVEERRYEEDIIGGDLVILPNRGRQSDGDIRREIKALEAERRALKLEREADERRYQAALIRDGDYEVVERAEIVEGRRERARSVVRVEKDRKGRLALVKSAY